MRCPKDNKRILQKITNTMTLEYFGNAMKVNNPTLNELSVDIERYINKNKCK